MKLRNKKTEEIVDVYNIYISKRVGDDSLTSHENVIRSFDSIAELNEEWEDYKPTEPLIKDDKIRKVVRAWAELLGASQVIYVGNDYSGSYCWFRYGKYEVDFEDKLSISNGVYTITELCGEEEE